MSIIGSFTKQDEAFSGTLRTLSLNVKCRIVPTDKTAGKGPDYRVVAGALEIGAAWKRQSKANREYLSVSLDDPVFPDPIRARLINGVNGELQLFWTRRDAE